jgi:hypothetical protein
VKLPELVRAMIEQIQGRFAKHCRYDAMLFIQEVSRKMVSSGSRFNEAV